MTAAPAGPAPTRLARRVVADVLGDAPVAEVAVLQTTPASWVLTLAVGIPPRRLVLKLVALDTRPAVDLERTAAVMRRAADAGVPVPTVLGADASGRVEGWQHLLTSHAPGRPWREVRPGLPPDARAVVEGRLAAALLRLQSVRFAGFGELDATGRSEELGLLPALRQRVRLRVPAGPALALAEQLLDRTAGLLGGPGPATLTHDDLHHDNVLVAPGPAGDWQVAAVLDWDKAWAGPAESDLARMALWDGMTGPGFWPVLRAARPPSDGEDERRLVHQLLWCLEYDVPTARHRADTADLCRRLGLEPPPR